MVGIILILAKFIVIGHVIRLMSGLRCLAPDLANLGQNHYQIYSGIGTTQTAPIFILERLFYFDFLRKSKLQADWTSGCLR